jgi:transposase
MSALPNPDNPPTRFIGCDVGKTSVVIFDSATARSRTVANTPEALSAFLADLDGTCLVVCESTGGYEAALLAAALTAGCPAHRADGRRVKHFIRSLGILGKTDGIDARALARYGQERHADLLRWQMPDHDRDRLQILVNTRRDLVAERQAWKNRRAAPGVDAVAGRIEALIACLNTQIAAVEGDMQALIRSQPVLDRCVRALRGITGFGAVVSASLLALLPELGQLDRRKIAALAGLAPHPNQSGQADRYRPTRGGRQAIRPVLFFAALTAVRHNPKLRAFYQRLIDNRKRPIVALVAVARKLVTIANAIVRDQLTKTSHQVS